MRMSRYQHNDLVAVSENNDKNKTFTMMSTFPTILPKEIETAEDSFYTITSTDRLDTIAHQFYGEASYWWVICLANEISSPFDKTLTPGKILRIPSNVERVMTVIKAKSKKAY